MAPWSRLAGPVYKNTGSVARDHLASERTYLAWTRTGLGFVALGIAVERFSRFEAVTFQDSKTPRRNDDKEERRDQSASRLLVGTLMALGTGCIVYATRRYFVVLRLLEKGEFRPAYRGVAAMGAVLGALGGGMSTRTASAWFESNDTAGKD